jgi:hypothetical protein
MQESERVVSIVHLSQLWVLIHRGFLWQTQHLCLELAQLSQVVRKTNADPVIPRAFGLLLLQQANQ